MPTEGKDIRVEAPLVDHHCHGVVPDDLDRAGFEALISESFRPPPPGTSNFQKPLGLMVRRWCAPVLDLEPYCDPEAYVTRRGELGAEEVNRRFLRGAGLERLLVDTGHRSDTITEFDALGRLADRPAHEVVRIEAVIEEVARAEASAANFASGVAETLARRSEDAVGLKSIVAYRTSFMIDQTPPPKAAVEEAAGAWLKRCEDEGRVRVDDPVLIRLGLWTGAEVCRDRNLPLQLHVGVGDPDITMHACDPTHFTEFIRAMEDWGVPITLLHCYPFQREAGWLAEIFQNVYYDVGFILNFTGPSAADILGEALELGPFTKQLYSSDAFGLSELYYLGQLLFRRAFRQRLERWIADDMCTISEAEKIFSLIAAENARRIYPLP